MAHKEMSKPGAILLFIVTLPFVIAGLIIFGFIYIVTTVIPSPIELIIYKNSQFYKDLKLKYTMGITGNFGYKSYKYVKENPTLDIVFQEDGYYYYKKGNSVLVIPYYASYENENGQWTVSMSQEGDGRANVQDAKLTFAPLIKEDISELDVKLLVKEKNFKKEAREKAKADPVFVFYKNHKDFKSI